MIIDGKEIRVLGFVPAHYGTEYGDAAIKSMEPFCDRIVVIYSSQGSQGTRSDVPCPESEDDVKAVLTNASLKVEWYTGFFHRETDHRQAIYQYLRGEQLILSLDTDEILEPKDVPAALENAYNSGARYINIKGFINFWRSFNHVCLDGFLPYRIENVVVSCGTATVDCRIYHFSTAQSEAIVRYKWHVSGHRAELKNNWIDGVYLAWNKDNNFGDLHPVSIGLWNTVPFDKTTLPPVLLDHPNYNLDVI